MSKARQQTANRHSVRHPFKGDTLRKNNRKDTSGRHTQRVGKKLLRHY